MTELNMTERVIPNLAGRRRSVILTVGLTRVSSHNRLSKPLTQLRQVGAVKHLFHRLHTLRQPHPWSMDAELATLPSSSSDELDVPSSSASVVA